MLVIPAHRLPARRMCHIRVILSHLPVVDAEGVYHVRVMHAHWSVTIINEGVYHVGVMHDHWSVTITNEGVYHV